LRTTKNVHKYKKKKIHQKIININKTNLTFGEEGCQGLQLNLLFVISGKVLKPHQKDKRTTRGKHSKIFRHKWKPTEEKRSEVLESKREAVSANCR
jgi:hypothetical protein